MAQIPATYASPNLRVGLLLEDHPNATYKFFMVDGNDPRLGLPPGYGGSKSFCLCVLDFNDGKPQRFGYKQCGDSGTADEWNILCTKALGRALKRAGYPDDTKDLKALVLWRQRSAEIEGISTGRQQLAIDTAERRETGGDPALRAIDAAGTKPPPEVPDSATPEQVAEGRAMLAELIEGLDVADSETFMLFANETCGIEDPHSNDLSADEVDRLLGWFDADVVDAPGS